MMFHRISAVLWVLSILASCSTETLIGQVDGRTGPPLTDECGNGFDDDGDGRIDEDPCVCGTAEVQDCWTGERGADALGLCAAGTQRCSATGSQEFGVWESCSDVVAPATEECEGRVDEDCDGAIDEGCGGCAPGVTRACAGAVLGPCIPGAQTCSAAGEWSGCEGAVRPVTEICRDGIDNDCDGTTDDPAFCDCTPMPEVCADGVDNDCDGVRDEPACRTCEGVAEVCNGIDDDCDGTVDEGACTDGGLCAAPTVETCDGIDDDCDGVIDNGACPACACDRWAGTDGTFEISGNYRGAYRGLLPEAAFDGEAAISMLHGNSEIGVSTEVLLDFIRPDGSSIGSTRSLAVVPDFDVAAVGLRQNGLAGPVAFGGGRFVGVWATGLAETGAGALHAAAFTPDGSMVVGPVTLDVGGPDARMVGLAMVGTDAYLVYQRTAGFHAQRFDATLAAVGSPVEIPLRNTSPARIDVSTVGDAVAITGTADPETTVRTVLVRDGRLVGFSDLGMLTVNPASADVAASAASNGAGDALVCAYTNRALSCRHINLMDARPTGPSFTVAAGEATEAFRVLSAGCGYQIVIGTPTGSGPQSIWRTYELDRTDSVRVTTIDRRWIQATRSFAAFRTNAGGMLRVIGDEQIALRSCAPALPEPDCDALQADIMAAACGACSGDTTYCAYLFGNRGSGTARDSYTPPSCADMDAVACRIAMDQPIECVTDGGGTDGFWIIPADCWLPR